MTPNRSPGGHLQELQLEEPVTVLRACARRRAGGHGPRPLLAAQLSRAHSPTSDGPPLLWETKTPGVGPMGWGPWVGTVPGHLLGWGSVISAAASWSWFPGAAETSATNLAEIPSLTVLEAQA